MTQILNDVFGISAKLKCTHYTFYRGMEWLRYHTGSYSYVVCAQNNGNYLTIEQSYCDDDGELHCLKREVLNGYGKYTYEIA